MIRERRKERLVFGSTGASASCSIVHSLRNNSIVERLKAIGYSEDTFPNSREWDKLVEQPKELTDRSKSMVLGMMAPMLRRVY